MSHCRVLNLLGACVRTRVQRYKQNFSTPHSSKYKRVLGRLTMGDVHCITHSSSCFISRTNQLVHHLDISCTSATAHFQCLVTSLQLPWYWDCVFEPIRIWYINLKSSCIGGLIRTSLKILATPQNQQLLNKHKHSHWSFTTTSSILNWDTVDSLIFASPLLQEFHEVP